MPDAPSDGLCWKCLHSQSGPPPTTGRNLVRRRDLEKPIVKPGDIAEGCLRPGLPLKPDANLYIHSGGRPGNNRFQWVSSGN